MTPVSPVQFYGSALPRPRFLADGSNERVDPPVSVNDSLLRWAAEANWYMGGLSFKKRRMQGKIEGSLKKLRGWESDAASTMNPGRKSKASPGKASPKMVTEAAALKSEQGGDEEASKREPIKVGERDDRGGSGSHPIVAKKTAAVHPAAGEWGEEGGPTALKSLRMLDDSIKLVTQTPAPADVPIRRRRLPESEGSDSDLNWEEFSRTKRPLRRSSRVTSIRRSFKELASSDSEES